MDSFFEPSDDYDADSYESQKERFSNDAYIWALELLVSTDEAIAAETVTMLQPLVWRLGRSRGAVIRVTRDGKIRVRLGRSTEPPA